MPQKRERSLTQRIDALQAEAQLGRWGRPKYEVRLELLGRVASLVQEVLRVQGFVGNLQIDGDLFFDTKLGTFYYDEGSKKTYLSAGRLAEGRQFEQVMRKLTEFFSSRGKTAKKRGK